MKNEFFFCGAFYFILLSSDWHFVAGSTWTDITIGCQYLRCRHRLCVASHSSRHCCQLSLCMFVVCVTTTIKFTQTSFRIVSFILHHFLRHPQNKRCRRLLSPIRQHWNHFLSQQIFLYVKYILMWLLWSSMERQKIKIETMMTMTTDQTNRPDDNVQCCLPFGRQRDSHECVFCRRLIWYYSFLVSTK